jgi:hypothetical protein
MAMAVSKRVLLLTSMNTMSKLLTGHFAGDRIRRRAEVVELVDTHV